jgi:hypothetical protein
MEKMLDMQTPNPDISEEENEYDILYKNRKYDKIKMFLRNRN